jgi:hypothetical protein
MNGVPRLAYGMSQVIVGGNVGWKMVLFFVPINVIR